MRLFFGANGARLHGLGRVIETQPTFIQWLRITQFMGYSTSMESGVRRIGILRGSSLATSGSSFSLRTLEMM